MLSLLHLRPVLNLALVEVLLTLSGAVHWLHSGSAQRLQSHGPAAFTCIVFTGGKGNIQHTGFHAADSAKSQIAHTKFKTFVHDGTCFPFDNGFFKL